MSRAQNISVTKDGTTVIRAEEQWEPLKIEECAQKDVPVAIMADPPKCHCGALAATDGLSHCNDHTRKVKFDGWCPLVRRECPHYGAALVFLDKLQVEHHLDHFHDRCFCAGCLS